MKTEKLLRVLGGVCVLLALVTLSFFPACAPKEKPLSTPVKIGLLGDFTGSFAGKGQQVEAGTRMRLDEAGWEVAGRKIELIVEDDASSAETGLEKARKLIGVNKVDVILGPLKTEIISAVGLYGAQKGIPIICHGSHPLQEIEEDTTLFALQGPEIGKAVGFGRYVCDKKGYKTAVYIAHDFRFAHTIAESFAIGFKEGGGTVLKETYVPFGTMDFTSYLIAAGRPDCLVVFLVSPPDILRFYKQYSELGLKNMPILSPEGGAIQPVLQQVGKDIIGVVGFAPYADSIDTDINKRFVENFVKKYGHTPGTNDELGYSAASVFLETLTATGGDTTPVKVLEALKKTKIDLPSGYLEIGSDRISKKYMFIFECVEKGGTYMFKIIDKYLVEVPKR
jgi:branched-chain amino acid transport system substrate-binding protein